MNTYIIEEVASYYVKARSARAAEKFFLKYGPSDNRITCEVHEREVYKDPENRDLTIPQEDV